MFHHNNVYKAQTPRSSPYPNLRHKLHATLLYKLQGRISILVILVFYRLTTFLYNSFQKKKKQSNLISVASRNRKIIT